MAILYYPACISILTEDNGEARLSIQVPGVFGLIKETKEVDMVSAFDGYQRSISPEGRYLDYAEFWSTDDTVSGRVTQLKLIDQDGVIPEYMRPAFPLYPIIENFYDSEIKETDNLKQGLFLKAGSVLRAGNIGSDPSFVAAGLYLTGTFIADEPVPNRVIRCNFHWGKRG